MGILLKFPGFFLVPTLVWWRREIMDDYDYDGGGVETRHALSLQHYAGTHRSVTV